LSSPVSLPPLRDVIKRFRLGARRSLGQHFILDLNLCARITRAAGDILASTVIEIGPGPGGLTRALLDAGAAKVIAVERDERCVAALAELAEAYPERLEIIEGDALEADLVGLTGPPRCIVSNLPYNIATPLLIGWLQHIGDFERLTLMFQQEVAARLAARPGTREYGRLSIITQWLCDVRREFNVDGRAFTPPPKVASAVVTLNPRLKPLAPAAWDALETVTAAAFGQRRKMLRASLKPLCLDPRELGIDPTKRAGELTVEEFCALARRHEQGLLSRSS
jgi:16S rRNA (adenine1518-N6/adenine1519-N6)-dimethyltransferase